jgi:hypothetical protein
VCGPYFLLSNRIDFRAKIKRDEMQMFFEKLADHSTKQLGG